MFAAALAVVLMLLLCSNLAFAGWAAPRSFSVVPLSTIAVAVDGRGDAAVAWMTPSNWPSTAARYRTSVHLVVRTANGQLLKRMVWSSTDARPKDLSVALGHSEVTVVWDSYSRAETRTTVIRAAYGPLRGRWSPAQMIARIPYEPSYPPIPWDQHLAIAPSEEVLLAYNAGHALPYWKPEGVHIAWRAPRHRFGASRLLRDAPGGAIPQFDTRGNAYLHGFCEGIVLVAPAHSHRFTRRLVLTSKPVLDFGLSLAGAGRGLASWIAGECSFDAAAGNTPGPVFSSVLSAGAFGTPLALTPAGSQVYYSNAVAVPGGGTVTWATNGPSGAGTFSLPIGANGLPGATQQITGGPIALIADGGGDEVFGFPPNIGLPPFTSPSSVFVRPAGGGADQPAPAPYGQVAVAAPVGRAAALAWSSSRTDMALSVWRP
jgi:hypothetical protein